MNKSRMGFGLLTCLLCNMAAAQCRAPAMPGPPPYDYKDQVLSLQDIKGPLKLASHGLLAIVVPASGTDQWTATIANNASDNLRVLSASEFKHITDQGKFDFTEWQNNPYPSGKPTLTSAEFNLFRKQQKISITKMRVADKLAGGNKRALYFGTLHEGEATVFLSNKAVRQPNTTAIEISVSPEENEQPAYSRGREIKLTEADQGKDPVPISYGDTILLTLPGSAFDEWNDIDEKTGLHLTRMRSGEAGHVLFIFSVTGNGSAPLVMRRQKQQQQGKAFQFELRSVPGVSC